MNPITTIIKNKNKYSNDNIFLQNELPNYTSREFFLKYNENLTPYFCFYYLYDKKDEKLEEKVYYNEIRDRFKNIYGVDYITYVFEIALYNIIQNKKGLNLTYKTLIQNYCDENCNLCEREQYCF